MKITSLDHLVLTVASISRSIDFYQRVLGFEPREFKPGRYSLLFGRQKINLHELGNVVDPNVRHATPGSADICFLTETPIEMVLQRLSEQDVAVVQGPVRATGACRTLLSVYFYDPDENLIEVSNEVQTPLPSTHRSLAHPSSEHAPASRGMPLMSDVRPPSIQQEETVIRFNVFGTLVGVEWKNANWRTYYLGNEGKRRDADFVIPDDITESGLADYLAVLFHEEATPDKNEVKRLEAPDSTPKTR